MSASTSNLNLGRHVFGLAAVAFGVILLRWHEYNGWYLPGYVVYLAAAAEILGGGAIQFRRTAKTGAVALCAVFLAFALGCVPRIVDKPQIYNNWGNFFEQLSMMTGALIVFGQSSTGYGECCSEVGSAQSDVLGSGDDNFLWNGGGGSADQSDGAIAAYLLTVMLMMFGVLVWVPMVVGNMHSHSNGSELAETFAIAGTAWIFADLLSDQRQE